MIISLDNNTELQQFVTGDGNSIVFSSLNVFHHKILSSGFAIKFVGKGTEHYYLNNRHVAVRDNQYLLTNQSFEGRCEIESKTKVEGICVNISQNLMHEAIASQLRPDAHFSDLELGEYFSGTMFLENIYNVSDSKLGFFINNIQNNPSREFDLDQELYYKIAECILADQLPYYRKLQEIPSLKADTKKELLRKLLSAHQLISDTASQNFNITDYAKEVGMSEFHFYRLFKNVFKQSPKQLLLEKRFENAQQLLLSEKHNITEVAQLCGYADIFTFSKAFKKRFGTAPSFAI